MTHPARETCPVDLHYPERAAADLDLPAIVGQGRRIRRRHRLAKAGAAIVACAAAASVVAGLRGATFDWFPSRPVSPASRADTLIDSFVVLHPPVGGKLTLLSDWPAGWTTVAGLDGSAVDAEEARRLDCSHWLDRGAPQAVK